MSFPSNGHVPLVVDDTYDEVTRFQGYVKKVQTSDVNGELLMTVGVPIEDKYAALAASDHPGNMFAIVVYKKDWAKMDPNESVDLSGGASFPTA